MTHLSTIVLLPVASRAPVVTSAREAARATPVIPGGSREIFGITGVSAGSGIRFAIDGGIGCFSSPMHHGGGELQLVLDDADAVELLPLYL